MGGTNTKVDRPSNFSYFCSFKYDTYNRVRFIYYLLRIPKIGFKISHKLAKSYKVGTNGLRI